jgi:hypothetical protein
MLVLPPGATGPAPRPLAVALVVAMLTFLIELPLYTRLRSPAPRRCSSSSGPWIPAFDVDYHLGVDGISMPLILLTTFMTVLVVIAGWEVIRTGRPVHGRLPDHGRADDRRVRGAGRDAVLRVLGGDADPDVPHHRHLGRAAPGLRHHQVLPLHLPRLGVHAGRADLHVQPGRQLRILDSTPQSSS